MLFENKEMPLDSKPSYARLEEELAFAMEIWGKRDTEIVLLHAEIAKLKEDLATERRLHIIGSEWEVRYRKENVALKQEIARLKGTKE